MKRNHKKTAANYKHLLIGALTMVALTFPIRGATERPNTEVDSQEGTLEIEERPQTSNDFDDWDNYEEDPWETDFNEGFEDPWFDGDWNGWF